MSINAKFASVDHNAACCPVACSSNRDCFQSEGYTWFEVTFLQAETLSNSKVLVFFGFLILAPVIPAKESSHGQLIRQLFLVLELPKVYEQNVAALVSRYKQRNKNFDHFEDVVRTWAIETIGWKSLEPRLLEIYKSHFSEKEIRDILKFYNSPSGQQLLKSTPVINSETRQLAADAAREESHQLQIMLKKRADDLERKGIIKKRDLFQSSTPTLP